MRMGPFHSILSTIKMGILPGFLLLGPRQFQLEEEIKEAICHIEDQRFPLYLGVFQELALHVPNEKNDPNGNGDRDDDNNCLLCGHLWSKKHQI